VAGQRREHPHSAAAVQAARGLEVHRGAEQLIDDLKASMFCTT
jgi:uncharacterized protein YndB with AHSA1/START domain